MRSGRYGPYVTEVVEGDEKPRTASLFKTMSPETVTLEEALKLLTLPRSLGESDGEEVLAANGRYGPYVKRGKESRSLDSEEQLFSITPRRGAGQAGRAQAAGPAGCGAAAEGARRRPGQRQADRRSRRAVSAPT